MNSSDSPVVSLTREELYGRVWSTPMRKLAPMFGLSDVGLKKLCNRFNIPTPPVGYWVKKEFGKDVRQPPLPAETDPTSQVIRLSVSSEPKPRQPAERPQYPVETPELIALVERERDPKHRITVGDRLQNPHPVIQRTRGVLENRIAPDMFNLLRPYCDGEGVDLAVGKHSVRRALLLMNALFQALERRGWPVHVRPQQGVYEKNRVRCAILGEEFGFSLREKVRMIHVAREGRPRGPFDREVEYEPRGVFELSITGRHGYPVATWRDVKAARVEEKLNDLVVGLLVAVEKNRKRDEEERRREEQRLLAERVRKERERLAEIERVRIADLESMTDRWHKARRLRSYISAVKEEAARRLGAIESVEGLARWLEWAEQHAHSLDPLAASRPLPTYELSGDQSGSFGVD